MGIPYEGSILLGFYCTIMQSRFIARRGRIGCIEEDSVSHLIPFTALKKRFYCVRIVSKPRKTLRSDSICKLKRLQNRCRWLWAQLWAIYWIGDNSSIPLSNFYGCTCNYGSMFTLELFQSSCWTWSSFVCWLSYVYLHWNVSRKRLVSSRKLLQVSMGSWAWFIFLREKNTAAG